ncbi:MAG: hypothetical protein HFH91_10625 [Lachnospiraceae bacterium]|nr:hypothetical protein [Lachnospiraceae bacterium]
MHYIIGDVHNEAKKLDSILNQIQMNRDDRIFLLGDVFDRGAEYPDPEGHTFCWQGCRKGVSRIFFPLGSEEIKDAPIYL